MRNQQRYDLLPQNENAGEGNQEFHPEGRGFNYIGYYLHHIASYMTPPYTSRLIPVGCARIVCGGLFLSVIFIGAEILAKMSKSQELEYDGHILPCNISFSHFNNTQSSLIVELNKCMSCATDIITQIMSKHGLTAFNAFNNSDLAVSTNYSFPFRFFCNYKFRRSTHDVIKRGISTSTLSLWQNNFTDASLFSIITQALIEYSDNIGEPYPPLISTLIVIAAFFLMMTSCAMVWIHLIAPEQIPGELEVAPQQLVIELVDGDDPEGEPSSEEDHDEEQDQSSSDDEQAEGFQLRIN